MNIKKIVSAVSALAISVSAFAGMAVTANAAELVKYDFDTTSLNYTSKASNTVWTVAEAQGTALTTQALKLGSNGSGSNKYLGYDATLLETPATGAVRLSFAFEPLQVRSDKGASMKLQFADSENTPIFTETMNTGNATGVSGAVSASTAYGTAYTFNADLNFYNGTATYTVLSADGATELGTASAALTAKDLQKLYLANTNWLYGYVLLDDITVSTIETGVDVTFNVTDLSGNAIEGATITMGTTSVVTDANGQVTVNLPVGEYSYAVEKENTAQTDSSTGTVVVAEGDSAKTVDATLDAAAAMGDVTVNYYVTGTETAIQDALIEQHVVGTVLEQTAIDTVVSTDTVRYTLNTDASTALPYTVVNGAQSINLYYDVENAITYTVKAVDGETALGDVSTGAGFVGDELTYAYRKYLADDNNKITYACEAVELYATTTIPADGVINVEYAPYTGNDAWVIEGDDFAHTGEVTGYSGGKYGALASQNTIANQVEVFTLPSGEYTIEVAYHNDGAGHGNRGFMFRDKTVTDNNSNIVASVEIERYAASGIYSGTMSLAAEKTLSLTGSTYTEAKSGQSVFFDYAVVTRTGDYVAPLPDSVELTEATADFADETAEDAATGASVWSATITGTGATYSTIKAVVTATDTTTAEGTYDATTITTTGDVAVVVVVNRMASLIEKVVLSVVE